MTQHHGPQVLSLQEEDCKVNNDASLSLSLSPDRRQRRLGIPHNNNNRNNNNNCTRNNRNNTNRHVFATQMALMGTAVTLLFMLLLLVVMTTTYTTTTTTTTRPFWSSSLSLSSSRLLAQVTDDANNDDTTNNNNNDNNNNNNNQEDYSSYSCHDLYKITPNAGEAQCRFARTCNAGSGVWAPSVFCWHSNETAASSSSGRSAWYLAVLYSPVILLWMILLFRLLASTAEDFFSPALEMLSVQLGLPPRFAGVSLLALGNGAADVSATVSAISNDPAAGYQMATGALTGAAMFISAVVSAVVVLAADGVPCRGALVRDVCMLGLTALLVFGKLQTGRVGPDTVTLFLSLYVVFVVLVLVADIYHRTVVVPRQTAAVQERERQRQVQEAQRLHQAAAAAAAVGGIDGTTTDDLYPYPDSSMDINHNLNDTAGGGTGRLEHFITALSNYDNNPDFMPPQDQPDRLQLDGSTTTTTPTGWGVESDDLARDRPIMLHGTHGILRGDGHLPSTDYTLPGDPTHHDPHHPHSAAAAGGDYSMLLDAVDRTCCVEPGSLGIPASNWRGAIQDGQAELWQHARDVWEDIVYNGEVDALTKFLLIGELPFTTLRKLTVPIPCEGYYVRALVALSMALSPLWLVYYFWDGHDYNILANGGWWYVSVLWLVMCVCALLVLRYAPGGEGNMALAVSTPIALYGFVIAATWIDTIADSLVSVLDFVGIMLRIPGPIVGLTILAWGNSMGDLSANVTMARKGLGNMAMTACFAGPVFNILVGLGLGFGRLAAQTGQAVTEVHLPPSVVTGFVFMVLNSVVILVTGLVVGKGRINKLYGFAALSLYTVYVITSLSTQYAKGGSSESDGNG